MSNNSEIKTLGDPERLLLSKPTEEERAIFQFYKDNPSLACKDLLKQDLAPFQRIVIDGVMSHSFVISVLARGSGKTRMMAMCAALLAMFNPKMRVLLIGPSFRQSKLSFNEFLDILDGSEHLDACVKRTSRQTDMWTAEFHNNAAIFSMPLVADNPASIRGIRAHAVLIDEYPHVPKEVIDAVINPMLATVRNPMAAVRKIEYENKLREMGMEVESEKTNANKICGFSSAYYQYNHMYKTMQEYKKLAIEEKTKYGKSNHAVYIFNYKDAPEGFFDMETVEHSRRTSPDIIFAMEYLSEFPADSEGFYKRSLLDSCISEPPNDFYIELEGDTKSRYIVGIDPARNSDSLAIVILKLDGEYMKLVNVITFQNTPFPLVARFLRNLLKKYNIELIGMDAGGGGLAMKDLLEDPTTANTKDEIVLDIDDELSVGKEGRKILRMIDFHSGWISEANFDLRTSLEHGKIRFPNYRSSTTYVKPQEDTEDPLDKSIVEYLKTMDETASIIMTATKSGQLHFDTPKEGGSKDRYSALLIAHKILSDIIRAGYQTVELGSGGFISPGGRLLGDVDSEYEWKETRTIEELQNHARKIYKKDGYDTAGLA